MYALHVARLYQSLALDMCAHQPILHNGLGIKSNAGLSKRVVRNVCELVRVKHDKKIKFCFGWHRVDSSRPATAGSYYQVTYNI